MGIDLKVQPTLPWQLSKDLQAEDALPIIALRYRHFTYESGVFTNQNAASDGKIVVNLKDLQYLDGALQRNDIYAVAIGKEYAQKEASVIITIVEENTTPKITNKQLRIETEAITFPLIVDTIHLLFVAPVAPLTYRNKEKASMSTITSALGSVSTLYAELSPSTPDKATLSVIIDGTEHKFRDTEGLARKIAENIVQKAPQSNIAVNFTNLNGCIQIELYYVIKLVVNLLEEQKVRVSSATQVNMVQTTSKRLRGFAITISELPDSVRPKRPTLYHETYKESKDQSQDIGKSSGPIWKGDPEKIKKCLQSGCAALIKAEAEITEHDVAAGDGDCGYTMRDGAQVTEEVDLADLPAALHVFVEHLEDSMGGTSGALFCIFLTALSQKLAANPDDTFARSLEGALKDLQQYTRARVGDRTLIDALGPFVSELNLSGDLERALKAAKDGVDATRRQLASLGRATYVSEENTEGVPDAGAVALLRLFEGFAAGLK